MKSGSNLKNYHFNNKTRAFTISKTTINNKFKNNSHEEVHYFIIIDCLSGDCS